MPKLQQMLQSQDLYHASFFFRNSFSYVYASCIGEASGFLICMPLLFGIAWFSVFESFAGSCKCLVAAGMRSACHQRSKHVITATIMYPPACASHEIKSASWKPQSLNSRLFLSGRLRRHSFYVISLRMRHHTGLIEKHFYLTYPSRILMYQEQVKK